MALLPSLLLVVDCPARDSAPGFSFVVPSMARPPKYNAEAPVWAIRLCRLGATDAQLADAFGVAESTISRWKIEHPEFQEALKKGKAFADAEVADALFKRATGYSHPAVKIFNDQGAPLVVDYVEHYPPDTTACIFWLKNRQPALWRDKVQQELSGPDGKPLPVQAPSFVVSFVTPNAVDEKEKGE